MTKTPISSEAPLKPKEWSAQEVKRDKFMLYITAQIGGLYERIKAQSPYGDLERIEREIEDWKATAAVTGEIRDIARQVRSLLSQAAQLKCILTSLEEWAKNIAVPAISEELNRLNYGPGVFEQIHIILEEMYG